MLSESLKRIQKKVFLTYKKSIPTPLLSLALENVKGIEMRYHDGIMENYEKYYEGQMNELKTKVRAAVSFNQGAQGQVS